MTTIRVLLSALAITAPVAARAEIQAPDTVVVPSGPLKLKALLWQPAGRWPTIICSGRPAHQFLQQAAMLGPVFARHGFAFLFLFRRGAGLSTSQGVSAADLMDRELAANGQEARNRTQLRLLATDELTDALAGLAFLRALPKVDARHIVVAGHSV